MKKLVTNKDHSGKIAVFLLSDVINATNCSACIEERRSILQLELGEDGDRPFIGGMITLSYAIAVNIQVRE